MATKTPRKKADAPDEAAEAPQTPVKKDHINLDVDFTRQNEFLIAPEDIILGKNGRWQPHPETGPDSVEEMYESFRDEKRQLQAVEVRRVAGNKVELVLGYRRLLGARLFNKLHPEAPMKLRAKVVTCNDEEALRRNVVENRVRSWTSPVDDAHNQRTFREEHGWDNERIAAFYKMSVKQVEKLEKIPGLPFDIQMKIHRKELAVDAALDLTALPSGEQKEVIESIKQEGGEVTTETVRKKTRVKKIEAGGAEPRTIKEIKEFLTSLSGPEESKDLRLWCERMLWFIQGKVKDEDMMAFLRSIMPGEAFAETQDAA